MERYFAGYFEGESFCSPTGDEFSFDFDDVHNWMFGSNDECCDNCSPHRDNISSSTDDDPSLMLSELLPHSSWQDMNHQFDESNLATRRSQLPRSVEEANCAEEEDEEEEEEEEENDVDGSLEYSPVSNSALHCQEIGLYRPASALKNIPRASNTTRPTAVRRRSRRRRNQLWQFLLQALEDPQCSPQYIRWEDRERGIFRFIESKKVAQIWGALKQRRNMTFEYFSRAIRYYYAQGIMNRVCGGRRLVYQFGPNAEGWRDYALRQQVAL